METLLKKLNYKGTSEILISNAPAELASVVEAIASEAICIQDIDQVLQIEFALFFVLDQHSVDELVPKIASKLVGDCTIWFCYPKKSSSKYKCDIDRDHGWQVLGTYGFEPVRQVAINEDFSALRFRRVENIKTITRSSEMMLTEGYINLQPEKTKKALIELRSYIFEAVPDAVELINYGIPAYALVKGGKRDQQIMIAGYKSHVGLYPHPTAIEHFMDELKGYKMGKGSIQFPINKPLPKDLIVRMVKYRKALIDGMIEPN